MNKNLLNEVKKKRDKRNILTNKDFQLPMDDFILKIYNVCTPNKYGDSFPLKIQHDIGVKLKKMPRTMDRGDLHINYKKFLEAKISYLDLKGNYSITNIRDWQDLDYFILCFVDSNFKASFYCVPKKVVTDNPKLSLTGMNNSKKINSYNTYVGKRTSFDSVDTDWLFKKKSVLKGTTYKDLVTFLNSLILKLKTK